MSNETLFVSGWVILVLLQTIRHLNILWLPAANLFPDYQGPKTG